MLSNPLSGGELVLVALAGGAWYALTDFVGRYMTTTAVAAGAPANQTPQGALVPNDQATSAFPPWQAMAAQFGMAAVPGVLAAFMDSPWARAALQGAMLGAGFSLFGGLLKGAMAYLLANQPIGQQLYLAEIEAQQAVSTAQAAAGAGGGAVPGNAPPPGTVTATGTVTAPAPGTGVQGLPQGVGKVLLRDMGPMAPARGVGQPLSAAGLPAPPVAGSVPTGTIQTNTGDLVSTAAPGTPLPEKHRPEAGPGCAPCTTTHGGIAATAEAAQDAINDSGGIGFGHLPGGVLYGNFPEEEAA